MTRRGSIVIAVLLVSSGIMPFVAVAQTSDDPAVYERTFTDSQDQIGVDTGNYTGTFAYKVIAHDAPGGDTLIYREEGIDADKSVRFIMFRNQGAYDNITVQVVPTGGNSGAPSFVDGGELPTVRQAVAIGSTGGDADLTCGLGEQLSQLTTPGTYVVDCDMPEEKINTSDQDATQVKSDIYQSAQNQKASAEIYQTTLENYLKDTKTLARILGKNAYIRALNNGDGKAAAKTAAKRAVLDYYAAKQANLIKYWEATINNYDYLDKTAKNESIASSYVDLKRDGTQNGGDFVRYHGLTTTTVTLVNGTSVTTDALSVTAADSGTGDYQTTYAIGPTETSDWLRNTDQPDAYPAGVDHLLVRSPSSISSGPVVIDWLNYSGPWNSINSQSNTVTSDMDTLAANTYDAYQAGEINNSDLIDPYVFSQEFSPGDEYQGWAAAQLTMLGVNSPEALDETGHFNITTESGDDYRGILMSQENPPSGQFAVNETYNPSQINGTQWVVSDGRLIELQENFTLTDIETTNGEARQNVTIRKTTYETADVNTTELRETYEELAYWRSMAEARQQALNSGGGGGGFLGGGSINQTMALLALAALAGGALLNS